MRCKTSLLYYFAELFLGTQLDQCNAGFKQEHEVTES